MVVLTYNSGHPGFCPQDAYQFRVGIGMLKVTNPVIIILDSFQCNVFTRQCTCTTQTWDRNVGK